MKKFSQKILVTASVIFTCLSLNFAFADAVRTDSKPQTQITKNNISESVSNSASVEDPDLKLSIEELRKKYPIDWFDKKFGDYSQCEGSGDDEKEDDGSELICGFTIEKSKVGSAPNGTLPTILFDPLKQLNEAQLKSIILHYNAKSNDDLRIDHILSILLDQFHDKKNSSPLKQKIRNFFYSDKTLSSYTRLSCDLLIKFDSDNTHYDDLALGYFRNKYAKSTQVNNSSFESSLNRCVVKNKITAIKNQITKELQSKIKR